MGASVSASAEYLDLENARSLRRRMEAPPVVDRARAIQAAVAAAGTSWISRLWQATRGPGRLSIDEYFYYRLDDPALPADEVARFVGKRIQHQMHTACNDRQWFAVCHDKALFYTTLRGAGLTAPETVAVHAPRGRSGPFRSLRSEEELRAFLTEPSNYPLFAKPVDGIFSIGALSLLGVAGGDITLKGGDVASVDELIRFTTQLTGKGYLFQKVLASDPGLAAVFGDALPAIRFLVIHSDGPPVIESAVIKIPRRDNMADNYWRAGNMLGALDLAGGEIYRVVTGHGADLAEVARHPDTGAPLTGVRVPRWAQAVELCLDAATAFPGIRTQSWDVALTAAGPVLLELNFGGDLNLHQLAHRRGMLRRRFTDHLRRCGYKGHLPQ